MQIDAGELPRKFGGERGIRTPDTLTGTPDFESGAFSRSASSPEGRAIYHRYGGEGGIRTHDTLPYTRFPSVRLRPLGHLSRSNYSSRHRSPSLERAAFRSGSTGDGSLHKGGTRSPLDPPR